MKTTPLVFLLIMVSLILTFASCKFDNHQSDEMYFAAVEITVRQPDQNDSDILAAASNSGTSLISVVPGSITDITSDTDFSVAYDRQVLAADNTVNLQLPLETPIRLIKADYSSSLNRTLLISTEQTPTALGLSDVFDIDADTSEKAVEITMTSGSTTTTATTTIGTVTVSNVRDKGVINSGFLNGTASVSEGTIATVEVSIDSGVYQAATGTTSWRFMLPSGAATWKDWSQHTIMVKATTTEGKSTEIESLTIRKGTNQDVNGDGYPDVLVGAKDWDTGAPSKGRVYLFLGGATGLGTVADARKYTNDYDPGEFGESVALGDLNGDGYADVAVGEPYNGVSDGRVRIFYGGSGGKALTDQDFNAAGAADQTIVGTAVSGFFGYSMAMGDFNGDGYTDLAVAKPDVSGIIYIFHGSASGISATDTTGADTQVIHTAVGTSFAIHIKAGDLNSDGYSDLIINYTAHDTNRGKLYIFNGSSTGIDEDLSGAGSASHEIVGAATLNRFGFEFAVGDFNGDGNLDLAANSPDHDSDKGRIYLFIGTASGITITSASAASSFVTGGTAADELGQSLYFGDINGDGYADLFMGGMQDFGASKGLGYVFNGNAAGTIADDLATAATTLIGAAAGSLLGADALITDVNGDGYPDLLVSSYTVNTDTGRLWIFHSPGAAGIPDVDFGAGGSATAERDGETTQSQFATLESTHQ